MIAIRKNSSIEKEELRIIKVLELLGGKNLLDFSGYSAKGSIYLIKKVVDDFQIVCYNVDYLNKREVHELNTNYVIIESSRLLKLFPFLKHDKVCVKGDFALEIYTIKDAVVIESENSKDILVIYILDNDMCYFSTDLIPYKFNAIQRT